MTDKKIIGWFSAGVTSAVACKLAIQKYKNVELYYIETGSAHEDNKRFIEECEKWYKQPIHIIENSKGYTDVIDVINKTGYVNGVAGARCTLELKKEVRFELEKKTQWSNQIFGYEYDLKQRNRAVRFKQQYSYTNPLFPLIEEKITKNQCAHVLEKQGIELPIMYKLGYPNNNCIGCVKGGSYYWNKIRKDFPEEFERMAKAERKAGHSCIKGIFLDELSKNKGVPSERVMPDCGLFCPTLLDDIITEEAKNM